MAKSFDRDSYGSGRSGKSGAGSARPSAQSGRAQRRPRRRSASSAAAFDASAYGSGGSAPGGASGGIPGGASGSASGGAGSYGAGNAGSYGAGAYGVGPANPYSRNAHAGDYAKDRKRRKRRRILAACLVVVLVAVLGGAGAALAYMSSVQTGFNEGITQETLDALDAVEPGDPFYMLLLGTDKSIEREGGDELDGVYRTDSIMLLRVDPQQKKATAISLMRDTMVDMGEYGTQKLNAAYAFGGAAYAVKVVSEMAGVPIAHFAEIDFDGFRDIVDALGGVEVDVPIEIDDADAGGHLDAGVQTLTGEQALILCRSRHAFDEYGKGDEYRAANQRVVISAIASKILSADLATMASTVKTLSGYVTTDMGVMDILTLASSMRGMDMETDFYSCVNPTTSQYIDDIWWEVMDEAEWRTMLKRVEQGLPPVEEDVIDPYTGTVMATAGSGSAGSAGSAGSGSSSTAVIKRSGTVSVRNGTDIDGAGAAAAEKIGELGYTVDAANADASDYAETVVVYAEESQKERAEEIVNTLGVGSAVLNDEEYLFTSDFLVVIGADWS